MESERRQLGVVPIAAGLLGILIAVALLLAPRTTPLEGQSLLREWFAVDDVVQLPFDLRVDSAARLVKGVEVLRLVPSAAGARSDGDPESGPADGLQSVTLIHYPLEMANAQLEQLFRRPSFAAGAGKDGRQQRGGGPQGGGDGDEQRDWGELDWGRYRALYVLRRSRMPDRAVDATADAAREERASTATSQGESTGVERRVYDSLRVNLSQGRFACVLVAIWAPSAEGREIDPECLQPLLAELQPGAYERGVSSSSAAR